MAESEAQAAAAVKLIEVEYEDLPVVTDVIEAMTAGDADTVMDTGTGKGTRRVPQQIMPQKIVPQRAPRSLSSFIAGFKASVTSRVNRELNSGNIWQRNYYEHIIRNETELEKIWKYIDLNPLKWQEDQENPFFQGTEIPKK